jgi:hypothetical protein
MPARVVLNVIYAHLVAGRDAKQREEFDAELYAPPEGAETAEREWWENLARLADERASEGSDDGRSG